MKYELYDKQRFENMHKGKLTGKQIFEKGLANQNDDDDEEEEKKERIRLFKNKRKILLMGLKDYKKVCFLDINNCILLGGSW